MRNGFPISLFELCVKHFLDKRYISKVPVSTAPKKKLFISLPFFGLLSDELAVFLKEILPEYYPQINFNLCFKNSFTIEQQNHPFSIKDFSIMATSNNSSELRTL